MIVGRIVAGIGNGINTATNRAARLVAVLIPLPMRVTIRSWPHSAAVWHVETSKAEAKGKAVAKEMAVNVMGFVLSNKFTLAFSHSTTNAQWRFPLGIQLILCVMILALVWILPESPRWLLSRKREAEAKVVLAQLNDHDIEEEFREIRDSVREEMASKVSWLQLLKGGTPTRRLLLGMLLQVCQQLTGINLLSYFLPYVLHESIGLPEDPARILATGIAILYMIATGCSVLFVERLGRRKLLMWLSGAMAVALVGIAISSAIGQNGGSHLVTGIVAAVFITLYFAAFGLGWISVPWGYAAEINSLSLRTKGAALATAADWGFNYLVVVSSPPGLAALGWGLYVIYAVLNLLFIPVVYYLVVETAGKSLEQMDEWFAEHPGWRVDKISDGVAGEASGAVRRASDGDMEEEESRGLVKAPAPFGQDSVVYDRDAQSLEETDFAIGDESDLEADL